MFAFLLCFAFASYALMIKHHIVLPCLASMTAAYEIFKFSIVKNNSCDVTGKKKMFPFAKLSIKIIDNSQTKRVRDLKFLPDMEHRLRIKISIFAKGNILKC